jgi:hypothetical protein
MSETVRIACDCGWAATIGGSFSAEERGRFITDRVRDHLLLDKRHAIPLALDPPYEDDAP